MGLIDDLQRGVNETGKLFDPTQKAAPEVEQAARTSIAKQLGLFGAGGGISEVTGDLSLTMGETGSLGTVDAPGEPLFTSVRARDEVDDAVAANSPFGGIENSLKGIAILAVVAVVGFTLLQELVAGFGEGLAQ